MRSPPRLLVTACTFLLLSACGGAPDAIMVEDAYVRLPAVPGHPAAAYFTIDGGAAADRLLSVASPLAARAEMHASMMHGGAMTMTPLAGIDVPADTDIAFAPAGNHVMLFGLPGTVTKGNDIPLTLRFRSGTVVTIPAKAIAAGDEAPD